MRKSAKLYHFKYQESNNIVLIKKYDNNVHDLSNYKKEKNEKLIDYIFELSSDKLLEVHRVIKESENLFLIIENEHGSAILKKMMSSLDKAEKKDFLDNFDIAIQRLQDMRCKFSSPPPYKKNKPPS